MPNNTPPNSAIPRSEAGEVGTTALPDTSPDSRWYAHLQTLYRDNSSPVIEYSWSEPRGVQNNVRSNNNDCAQALKDRENFVQSAMREILSDPEGPQFARPIDRKRFADCLEMAFSHGQRSFMQYVTRNRPGRMSIADFDSYFTGEIPY